MTSLAIRTAAASLAAIAIAGCTTTGVGTGQTANGRLGATFTWTENGGTRGTMVAQLSNGQVFQGPFFQITSESQVSDYGPLWNGWGLGSRWGGGWGGRRWGYGGGGWAPWGPDRETIPPYSGRVPATLQGPGAFIRCDCRLIRPSPGMGGGGVGQCQLPPGVFTHAQFPPH